MREIERKFLVKRLPPLLETFRKSKITQGYLVTDRDGIEVRLRRSNDEHCLTVKRKRKFEREEHNVDLTEKQWLEMWPMTEGRRLSKLRYDIPHGSMTFEVDVFQGRNEGIVVVEVEFPDCGGADAFEPPDWFGREVTGDPEYSNPRLACD